MGDLDNCKKKWNRGGEKKKRICLPKEYKDMGCEMPGMGPESSEKDGGIVGLVQKKRRNDRWNGYMRDLMGECSNKKLRGGGI